MTAIRAISLPVSVFRASACLILIALFHFGFAYGADVPNPPGQTGYGLDKGMNEFGLWVGGSPDSNVAIGKTPDTRSFRVSSGCPQDVALRARW